MCGPQRMSMFTHLKLSIWPDARAFQFGTRLHGPLNTCHSAFLAKPKCCKMWNLSIFDAWSWLSYNIIAITYAQNVSTHSYGMVFASETPIMWTIKITRLIHASVSIVRNFGNSKLSTHFLNESFGKQRKRPPTHSISKAWKDNTCYTIPNPFFFFKYAATFLPFAPAEPLLLPLNIKSVKSFPVLISASFN